MDDLISREAAIEAVKIPNGEYPNPSERHGIIIARVEARRRIMEIPSVPAVPLDKLCEWLETDCILSCVSCEHLFGGQWCKQHPELPYRCHRKEHWKDALTKWMEEQNA